jgi:hypothetical protein
LEASITGIPVHGLVTGSAATSTNATVVNPTSRIRGAKNYFRDVSR